jgi:hypothetical protein
MMRQERKLDTHDLTEIMRHLTALIGYTDSDELLSNSVKEGRVVELQELVEKIDAIIDDRLF